MKIMRIVLIGLALGLILTAGGCASRSETAASSADSGSTSAPAPAVAPVPASSPLAKIKIGMSESEVRQLLGEPNNERGYPTAKNWIPFYFGGDTYRLDWHYPRVGKVIFGNTSRFSRTMKVVQLVHDPNQM